MSAILAYERICNFKSSRAAMLNGINYAYVVAPFLYDESVLGFLKKLFFSTLFATRLTRVESTGNGLLLYYSARNKRRSDYDYIPMRLRELLGSHCDYIESSESFSLAQVFFTLKNFRTAWRASKGYRSKKIQRLGCAFLIAKYISTAESVFFQSLMGRKRLITFCDAHAPENLMAQMAKFAGLETFTTQHGQYRVLDSSNMSPDAEAYANFVSDYMLCWGEATRSEFVKVGFASDRFIVTGWIKDWDVSAPHPPCGVFGVMLNGESGNESNLALLDCAESIACRLNLRYIIRLHPWSTPKKYTKFLGGNCVGVGHYSLSSYLEKIDFSIAHMTGAAIEMLHAKFPIYLLDDRKLAEVFRVRGLSFDSISMIEEISKDLQYPGLAAQRIELLDKWFNDDGFQSLRICEKLLG